MLKKLFVILPLILLLTLAVLATREYRRWHDEPLPVTQPHQIDVPAGASLSRLADRLAADGVIEHAWQLKLLARLRGDASRIHAGEYELQPGTSLSGLLDQLVAGRVKLHSLTIIEGMTLRELLPALEQHEAIRTTLETRDPEAVARQLDLPTEHAEGWFLPETYRFPRGTTDIEFLQRAHQSLLQVLNAAWEARDPDIPLDSPYEALILASIIEKETAVDSERRRIAGVFARRLQRGMRLETDPTVIYGLGEAYDGDLRYRDMRADTPYNTYRRGGLPPTPIAMPGGDSIFAAVKPAEGDELFFVARGPGQEHVFSATYEEHREAVRRYAMRRRALDESSGQDGDQ